MHSCPRRRSADRELAEEGLIELVYRCFDCLAGGSKNLAVVAEDNPKPLGNCARLVNARDVGSPAKGHRLV